MTSTTTTKSPHLPAEALAFAEAAQASPPAQLTACSAWTVHDLLAHVVAGGVEMARLIGERLAGGPVSETITFAEREPAARTLNYGVLIELLAAGGLFDAIDQLPSGARVPFTGWDMEASSLRLHVRSELALHRWDLVGSDETGLGLLSAPELTEHAVRSLTSFGFIQERVAARSSRSKAVPAVVRLRTEGQPDVVVDLESAGPATLRIEPTTDESAIETDAAARLLLLWGRRPPVGPHRILADGVDPADVRAVFEWLLA